LSTQGPSAVNARDRIGKGPWTNAKGVVIAKDVADLHGSSNNLNKQTALTEKGAVVNASGDTPNTHDILTARSRTAQVPDTPDMTCGNWTKSGAGSGWSATRIGRGSTIARLQKSWNSSHPSARSGRRLQPGRLEEHRGQRLPVPASR
jgi:hypothetical protein